MPDESEVHGLHALLLFQDARRDARVRDGSLVLLDEQDRSLWHGTEIAAGHRALERALALPSRGPYLVQAGIAAAHSDDVSDWPSIAGLYTRLAQLEPSPVVELNRAVALAMADGPEAGLAALDQIHGLDGYYLFHSARADLLRRLGRPAADAYARAIELAPSDVERNFLRARLSELQG
jgi:RNA polymerase sigma-70 factor (ECF subfamily)